MVATRVGRYRVLRLIAAGGMGAVYEAEQDSPRRTVALKLMLVDTGGRADERAARRFRAEGQFLAAMQHPGIAQVYEAGVWSAPDGRNIPYLAMEFVPGARTITSYATDRSLGRRERVELFLQACDAMRHGHARGVIHRDLKPENILVSDAGLVKVIDFGIARVMGVDAAIALTRNTQAGQILGTLQYMSPEQFTGRTASIDQRTDVYSLGVVLYELLCGRPPYDFRGTDLIMAGSMLRQESPPKPTAVAPGIDDELELVMLKALERDRERRYFSVRELSEDLRSWLAGQGVSARRPGPITHALRMVRRWTDRHGATTAVAAGLVATAMVIPAMPPWTRIDSRLLNLASRTTTPDYGGVRLVSFTDATDFEALGRQLGVEGVSNDVRQSWRAVHGRLMQRLADVRPRAVVFDIEFASSSDNPAFDAEFVRGVRALAARNIPVVVGVHRWPDVDTPAAVAETIRPYVRVGGLSMGVSDVLPWDIDLAVRKDIQRPMASLALMAVMSAEAPEADEHVLSVSTLSPVVGIEHVRAGRAGPVVMARRTFRATLSDRQTETDEAFNVQAGDIFVKLQVDPPSDDRLKSVTVAYERLFDAERGRLEAAALARRVVVIADMRSDNDQDAARHRDGRDLQKPYAHLDAIARLLGGRSVAMPSAVAMWGLMLVCGVIGASIPASTVRRPARWAGLVTAVAAVAAACVLGAWWFGVMAPPLALILCMLPAFALAWWLMPRPMR